MISKAWYSSPPFRQSFFSAPLQVFFDIANETILSQSVQDVEVGNDIRIQAAGTFQQSEHMARERFSSGSEFVD